MKFKIFLTFIFLFLIQPPSYSKLYEFSDLGFENSFNDFLKNKDREIQLEKEITDFLDEEQIPVSLDECLDVALQNNFNIKAKFETYKSYDYMYKNSLTKFLPNFLYSFYSIYYGGQVLVGTALVDNFNELALSSMISIEHNLTNGGKDIFNAKVKRFEKMQSRENLGFQQDEVIMNTSIYYYQLLESKINIEIHIKNLYERIIQLKLTENLENTGMGTKFDVIRQKSEVANAKRNLVEAVNEFRLRQAKLSNIMGIEITTSLYPIEKEANIYNLVDDDINMNILYETALKNRKDIKAMEDKIQALINERREIYTSFIPSAKFVYRHQNQGTSKEGMENANVVGLYVNFELGENLILGTTTKAKAKTCEINSYKTDLEIKKREIKEKLLDSYYNSRLLLKRTEITKERVNYATESVKLAEMRLDSGIGILVDVIQAQGEKTDAKIEYLQAVIEYNINQIELLFDEGIISIDSVIKNYNP